ncbi:GRF zinc finger protein [Artemisia annua]|uniref:GRF zinc finger protein n=1 Tax=Artemisia annua TaxID=35608 RepID=A0A2U1NT69_ARTAN|nr:GRF zinc finger protein [Artemisia annua]
MTNSSNSSNSSNWVYWNRRNAGWEKDNLMNRVCVLCECGDESGKWISWTQKNPGRRFLGCPNYKASKHCEFFHWWDPDLPTEHYKGKLAEVEKKMKKEAVDFELKKKRLEEEVAVLKTTMNMQSRVIFVLLGLLFIMIMKAF